MIVSLISFTTASMRIFTSKQSLEISLNLWRKIKIINSFTRAALFYMARQIISFSNNSKIYLRNFKWSHPDLKIMHAGGTTAVDIRMPNSTKTDDKYKVTVDRERVFTRDFPQAHYAAVRDKSNGYSSQSYAIFNSKK